MMSQGQIHHDRRNAALPFRMRNPDLDTATDILVTGEYQRLPKMLDVSFRRYLYQRYDNLRCSPMQRNFNPESAANTVTAAAALRKMNEIIAFRLAVHELVPSDLRLLNICQCCRLPAV
jgi:hypothetical protein